MAEQYPKIIYADETTREGMQIEGANIPVAAKAELLAVLSKTGLKKKEKAT